ncbi:hypothetical protein B0H11DRAFT_689558 [Mycena galericulata]|nr:hypothetical protein B0H11DRAFT_689558 [Mycena galericulata]
MENGWTRLHSRDVSGYLFRKIKYRGPNHCWISQANHIFSRLQITTGGDEYVFIDELTYRVRVSKTATTLFPAYLFLCPSEDLDSIGFAYWARDRAGMEHLNAEHAQELGLPTLSFSVQAWGQSWDRVLYAALRQFHRGKGFDPDSQDIARSLGYPLYEPIEESGVNVT